MLLERAHVISPDVDLPDASVRVRDGRIAAVGRDLAPEPGEEAVDLRGQYLAPGFIDIHTHGRSGHDFCDLTDMAFDVMGRDRLADGEWKAAIRPVPPRKTTGAWLLTLSRGAEQVEIPVSDFASVADVDDADNLFSIWF
jgi:predicted amidohydrolase YtcJ